MTTVSATAYMLEDFFRIMETMPSNYTLSDDTLQLIQNIDQNVTPIIVEKQYNTYNNNNRENTSNSTRPSRNNNNHHHSSSHGQSRSQTKNVQDETATNHRIMKTGKQFVRYLKRLL